MAEGERWFPQPPKFHISLTLDWRRQCLAMPAERNLTFRQFNFGMGHAACTMTSDMLVATDVNPTTDANPSTDVDPSTDINPQTSKKSCVKSGGEDKI